MTLLKCCVGGCDATNVSHRLFCLPKNDNLRSLWMSFLVPTNPLLLGLTKEQLLIKRVCHKHFDKHQLYGEGRRTRYSYPCLFSAEEISHGVPLSSEKSYRVLAEHNYHQLQEENDNDVTAEALFISGPDDEAHSYTCSSVEANAPAIESQAMRSTHEIPSCSYGETSREVVIPISTMKKASLVRKKLCPKKYMRLKKKELSKKAKRIAAESIGKSSLERLKQAQELSENPEFFKNFHLLSKQAKTLLIMQLRLVARNKMAYRFTMEEKMLALTFIKHGPKFYRLLANMLALPTKRTLNRLSQNICFEPGINPKVFKYLHTITKSWERKNKLCTITFDEVALSPHLTFNEGKDVIEGFVELGGEPKLKYCDHALVFMLRGICSPWRQTLAYYFCEGTVSAIELKQILKTVVAEVAQAGLLPLGLVCDQGSTFRTALKIIRQDTIRSRDRQGIRDYGTIEIAGLDLSVFYDPPHLLKSIRNNFLTKDIIFDGKTARWNDIIHIYDIDNRLGHSKAMPKLTAHHVIPEKIKKMKVSVAAQVLSYRTAAMLRYTESVDIIRDRGQENSTLTTTAEIVEFFDMLFDSCNGSPGRSKRGKLRSAVKENSPHMEFWQGAIKKLKNLKFRDTNSKIAIKSGQPRLVRVPCLEGWVTTLESFVRMSKLLFTEYGVEYYYPRCVNQDPLENFFGRMRAANFRNVNPDAHTFICTFKSLILSNLLSPHSQFSNCEEDDGESLLSLKFLFEDKEANKENILPMSIAIPSSSSQQFEIDLLNQAVMEKIKVQCSAYTAGYLCRKISKFVNCTTCVKTYTSNIIGSIHKFIQFREYKTLKRNNLAYPNESFLRLYRETSQYIHNYLNVNGNKKNVGKNIRNIFLNKFEVSWLGCEKHHNDVVKKFITITIRLQVHNWCKIINKIFKGDLEKKYVLKMEEPQKVAYNKYEKIKLRKKKLLK